MRLYVINQGVLSVGPGVGTCCALDIPDPRRKLECVWDCCRQENDIDVLRQHDDDFFPDDTSLKTRKYVGSASDGYLLESNTSPLRH